MLSRFSQRVDSAGWVRGVKRALRNAPVSSWAISALDRSRLRRLERTGDVGERSKTRWRTTRPAAGLTWGVELSGDPIVDVAETYGVFGAGRTVLEVGPGYGRVLRSCLARGVEFERYIGLDISAQNVHYLTEAFKDSRIEFVHGDAESASLVEPVDSILSFLTFKHLYPSFEPALGNLRDQLRRGGVVMFDLIEGPRAHFERDQVTFIREYRRSEVEEILRRTSLDLVAFDQVEHAPGRTRLLVVARNHS